MKYERFSSIILPPSSLFHHFWNLIRRGWRGFQHFLGEIEVPKLFRAWRLLYERSEIDRAFGRFGCFAGCGDGIILFLALSTTFRALFVGAVITALFRHLFERLLRDRMLCVELFERGTILRFQPFGCRENYFLILRIELDHAKIQHLIDVEAVANAL